MFHLGLALQEAAAQGLATAPSVGAYTAKGYDNSDSATTSAITTQASTNLLVFVQWEFDSAPPAITDSKGNTYRLLRSFGTGTGALTNFLAAYVCMGATGGSGHTFTATRAFGYPSIFVVEVPGAYAYDLVAASSTGSPYNAGTISSTGPALLIGFAGAENTTTVTHTVTSGFSTLSELNDGSAVWTGITAQRTVAAGAHSFGATITSSNDGAAFLLVMTAPPSTGTVYSYTGDGGVTTGGAAALKRTIVGPTAGGVVVDGAASIARTFAYVASGGLVLGGAADVSTTVAPPAGGDLVTGGAADLARTWAYTPTGGLVLGGASDPARTFAYTGDGGLAIGGAADTVLLGQGSYVGSGGVVIGGEAGLARTWAYSPEGGVTTGGEATASFHPAGGPEPAPAPAFSGRAQIITLPRQAWMYAGSGRVRWGGSADVAFLQAPAPAQPPAAQLFRVTTSGAIRIRGSASTTFLPRPRRNRDAEDLALLNIARGAR